MSPYHVIRRWSALPARQRAWLLGLAAFLPLLRLLLARCGFVRTRALVDALSTAAGRREPTVQDLDAARELAAWAELAGRRGPVRASCLPQSLLVYGVLRRRGFAPALQIGVRQRAGRFEAHAWVELAGVALGAASIDHTPLPLSQRTGDAAHRHTPAR